MKIPSSVASWTFTPWRASCCGAGCVTSNPQHQVYAPVTKRVFVTVARSPGYWRTTMGASAVPMSVLGKPLGSTGFVYVPPRNQIVLPGVTAAGPLRAGTRSHGFANEPSAEGEPVGEA